MNNFFNQTEEKYKSIIMGDTNPPNPAIGSIYQYGCFLISLCNGLIQKGYTYTPEQLNDILKVKGLWTGPYKNYIDVASLASKWPEVFTFFDQIDPWGVEPKTEILINKEFVVLGRVSAKPIGGTGDHYVLITKVQNGVAIIYDPWSKVEEPITNRWASFGYILGIRIFKVNPIVVPIVQPITDQTKLPIIDENGNQMEVQAARSRLSDQKDMINNLTLSISGLNTNITQLQMKLNECLIQQIKSTTSITSTTSTTLPLPEIISQPSIFSQLWKAILSLFKIGK